MSIGIAFLFFKVTFNTFFSHFSGSFFFTSVRREKNIFFFFFFLGGGGGGSLRSGSPFQKPCVLIYWLFFLSICYFLYVL
jgi:hypothetical protein